MPGNFPELAAEVAFVTQPHAVTPTYTDISEPVRGWGTIRGRQHELDRIEAGTATLNADNRDRRFESNYQGHQTNLVACPSFEYNSVGVGSWTIVGTGTSANRLNTDGAIGTACMEVIFNGVGATYGRSLAMTLTPGALYKLSGYIKRTAAVGVMNLDVFEAGVIDLSGITVASGSGTTGSGWQAFSETFVYPSNGSGSVIIRAYGTGTPVGSCRFDAIMLEPLSAANLIANWSFETNTTDWTESLGTLSRVATAGVWASDSQAGGFLGQVVTDGSGHMDLRNLLVPVNPSRAYRLLVGLRVTSGTPTVNIGVNWYDAASVFISSSSGGVSLSTTGVLGTLDLVPPEAAAYAQVNLTKVSGGVRTVQLDVVRLYEIRPAAAAYVDGDQDNCRWQSTPGNSRSYFGGPYYPNIKARRKVRITLIWDAVEYPVFTGYLRSPERSQPGIYDAIANLRAVDGLSLLARKEISGDFPAQQSDGRVWDVLDAADWPTAERDIDSGESSFQAITITPESKTKALQHLQLSAESEDGLFYIDHDGKAVFRDRNSRFGSPYDTPQATFGNGPGEIHYNDILFASDDNRIYNTITVQREGGVAQVRSDATSIAEYTPSDLTQSGQLIENDNECDDKAQVLLARYKDPQDRIVGLVFDNPVDPDTLWPALLPLEIGDMVAVHHRPLGDTADDTMISQNSSIEGIEMEGAAGGFGLRVTLHLSPVGVGYSPGPFWILDDPSFSQLDTSTRLTY